MTNGFQTKLATYIQQILNITTEIKIETILLINVMFTITYTRLSNVSSFLI